MNRKKMIGILLVAAGVLALVYGGFSYTQEEHQVDVGPIEFAVKDKERVNVPVWMGVAAVIGGVVVLSGAAKRL